MLQSTTVPNSNDLLNAPLMTSALRTPEAAVDTKAQRAKISKSDYAWPDADGGPKFPITTQAQVMSASRLLGRAKTDDATKAKIKAAIKRIAKRKGFDLPKSWASDSKATKKGGEATATVSDDMVRSALQRSLDNDPDPDADGDDDQVENSYLRCIIQRVFEDSFTYIVIEDWDEYDGPLYLRSYSIDTNNDAVLGNDARRVVEEITYRDYVGPPEDAAESAGQRLRAFIESLPVGTALGTALERYEKDAGETFGTIVGTAIMPGFNRSRQRFYPKETLSAAVPGFIGKKMYKDHSSVWDDRNRPERSVDDIGAVIESAWVNADGGIGYKAIIADPDLDAKLGLMAERGILAAIGVSVNYSGLATRDTVGDESVERIDSMALNSLDFVTEPGAWGDIAHLESYVPSGGQTTTEETDDMADDVVVKGLQEKIDSLVASVTTLTERSTQAEARALKAEVRTQVRELLAESVLPPVARDRIVKEWDGKESVEGLAERVADEITFIESVTGKKLVAAADSESAVEQERRKLAQQRGAPRRVVVGNGGTASGGTEAVAPPLPKISEVGGWMLGKHARSFDEQFVIKD